MDKTRLEYLLMEARCEAEQSKKWAMECLKDISSTIEKNPNALLSDEQDLTKNTLHFIKYKERYQIAISKVVLLEEILGKITRISRVDCTPA